VHYLLHPRQLQPLGAALGQQDKEPYPRGALPRRTFVLEAGGLAVTYTDLRDG